MNAIEFVKKFGLDLVKRDVAAWQGGFIKREDFLEYYGFDILDDLKQIIEAWELVERFGDLRQAKLNLEHMISHNQFEFCATNIDELQNAINLVEQCQ